MSAIGPAIRSERERAGWTLGRLAEAIGVSKSQMSLVESGQRSIDDGRVRMIEAALGIEDERLLDILYWDRTPPAVREEIARLSERDQSSRALAEKLRRIARQRATGKRGAQVLDELLKSGELRAWVDEHAGNVESPVPANRQIPIINSVAAGYPAEFTDLDYPAAIADDYIAVPEVTDPNAFAARVVGDSMEPDYREGEVVVFSPQVDTPDGSDCFIRLERNNQTTFKRVYFEDDGRTIRLQPINPKYPPQTVPREAVNGMYRAAYVMRRV